MAVIHRNTCAFCLRSMVSNFCCSQGATAKSLMQQRGSVLPDRVLFASFPKCQIFPTIWMSPTYTDKNSCDVRCTSGDFQACNCVAKVLLPIISRDALLPKNDRHLATATCEADTPCSANTALYPLSSLTLSPETRPFLYTSGDRSQARNV